MYLLNDFNDGRRNVDMTKAAGCVYQLDNFDCLGLCRLPVHKKLDHWTWPIVLQSQYSYPALLSARIDSGTVLFA